MAKIYNSELTEQIRDGAKIQQMVDKIPSELAEKVVPVMEVNPKLLKRCNVVRRATGTNSTSTVIYTTPTDKDFYIVAIVAGYIKDVTSTATYCGVSATVENTTRELLLFPTLTLTAGTGNNALCLPAPMKIDRGTSILVVNSTNVANVTTIATIYGYTVDNVKA